jgi:hypothetical protein
MKAVLQRRARLFVHGAGQVGVSTEAKGYNNGPDRRLA